MNHLKTLTTASMKPKFSLKTHFGQAFRKTLLEKGLVGLGLKRGVNWLKHSRCVRCAAPPGSDDSQAEITRAQTIHKLLLVQCEGCGPVNLQESSMSKTVVLLTQPPAEVGAVLLAPCFFFPHMKKKNHKHAHVAADVYSKTWTGTIVFASESTSKRG